MARAWHLQNAAMAIIEGLTIFLGYHKAATVDEKKAAFLSARRQAGQCQRELYYPRRHVGVLLKLVCIRHSAE